MIVTRKIAVVLGCVVAFGGFVAWASALPEPSHAQAWRDYATAQQRVCGAAPDAPDSDKLIPWYNCLREAIERGEAAR
jgi:hypothetical protein